MIKIRFNDEQDMRNVEFDRDGHVVTLIGDIKPNTLGFTTWRADGVTQLGDFSEYTTVYRRLDDGVQYSDDGSVWIEPEPVTGSDKPSDAERIAQLEEELKAAKILLGLEV